MSYHVVIAVHIVVGIAIIWIFIRKTIMVRHGVENIRSIMHLLQMQVRAVIFHRSKTESANRVVNDLTTLF